LAEHVALRPREGVHGDDHAEGGALWRDLE
jgi:hypothetical protein